MLDSRLVLGVSSSGRLKPTATLLNGAVSAALVRKDARRLIALAFPVEFLLSICLLRFASES